jgi:hypothetical protein
MIEKSRIDSLYDTTTRAYREQGAVVPRSTATDAGGDSETIKQYRRFFETHDLRGLPQRENHAAR